MKRRHTLTHLTTHSKLLLSVPLALLVSLCLGIVCPSTTNAATFTVTNTNDTGAGSLRQAIDDANSNANPGTQDVIEFGIVGAGTRTITAASSISITESVLIDGFTQSDASANTASFPDPMDGVIRVEIYFSNGNGFDISGSNIAIHRIVAYQPASSGDSFDPIVALNNANNFEILGSYIGSDFTGLNSYTMSQINRLGMVTIVNSDNTQLGSGNNGDRNILGMCGGTCVYVKDSTHLVMQGNNVGVGADGLSPFYGDSGFAKQGVFLDSGSNDANIGGDQATEGNYFYYLSEGALRAQDLTNLSIKANLFYRNSGVAPDPINNPNFRTGVVTLMGVNDATIGSVGTGKNRFAGNFHEVIYLSDSALTASPTENIRITGNTMGYNYNESSSLHNHNHMIVTRDNTSDVLIQDNTLHNNVCPSYCSGTFAVGVYDNSQNIALLRNSILTGASVLGIDIASNGPDFNDPNDVDAGPNELINKPGYTSIVENGGNTDVDFTIDVPAGNYRIEFFSNSSAIEQGENYLGYTTITSAGNGLEQFSHTLGGINHTNMTLTATRIDPSSPTGFGPTSEFGTTGQLMPTLSKDLAITKRLLNPQDKSVGNILNYQITLTNNGPGNLNLNELNNTSTPFPDNLFTDILPPQLTYVSISGPNIACTDLGPGSAVLYGALLANHSDHSIVTCGHTGNDVLTAGQSVTYTLSTQVIDLSVSDFTNHILAAVSSSTHEGFDPDAPTISSFVSSGNDIIDEAINYLNYSSFDNYSSAYSDVADLSLNAQLLNPQDVANSGSILKYSLQMKNNGPSTTNPQQFDGSGVNPLQTSLIVGLLPPGAVFVAQSNPDLNCVWPGPGSASLAPFFGTHTGYSLLVCTYVGSNPTWSANQTIDTTLDITYTGPIQSFNSYFLLNTPNGDGDKFTIQSAAGAGINNTSTDMFDIIFASGINNFARASYVVPQVSISNALSEMMQKIASLMNTGQHGTVFFIIGVILVAASLRLYKVQKLSIRNQDK